MAFVAKSNTKNITTIAVRENKVFIDAYGITLSYTVKTYIGTEMVKACERNVARMTYKTPERTGLLSFFSIFVFFSIFDPMQTEKHHYSVKFLKTLYPLRR
jgi:hypothetical protein